MVINPLFARLRFLQFRQTYFFASIILHIALFAALLSSSIQISNNLDSFEASVSFEIPDAEPVKAPKLPSNRSATSVKSIVPEKPTKTELRSNFNPDSSGLPFTSKKIDDILKRKSFNDSNKTPKANDLTQKKSDLLGYLRATKRTKQNEKEKTDQKQLSENNTQKVNTGTTSDNSKLNTKTSDIKPSKSENGEKTEIDGKAKNSNDNSAKTGVEGKAGNDQRSKAMRVWQKKNETQSYRRILRQLVTANWKVPTTKIKEFQIMIEAAIDLNGNLVQADIRKSSGLAILDAAAERAIRVSTPFPKIPKILQDETNQYKVVFRFTPDAVNY